MTTTQAPGGAAALPLTWTEFDEVPILFANHFLVQHHPEEFVLTLGQVSEPPLEGSSAEVSEQAGRLTHVPVTALAKVSMSRLRLTELIALLQAALEEHDRGR
jgi:hypothetical protein